MDPKYFIMLDSCPWAGPNAYPVNEIEENFYWGEHFEDTPSNLKFTLRVDGEADNPLDFPPLDYHKTYHGPPIFSARMVDVLGNVGVSNIDYYPAQVTYETNENLELSYFAANIIGVVEGLDRVNSDIDVDEDDFVEVIRSMKFDESRFMDQKVLRLYENLRLVIISQDVKSAIEGAGLTGINVITDDAWKPGMI